MPNHEKKSRFSPTIVFLIVTTWLISIVLIWQARNPGSPTDLTLWQKELSEVVRRAAQAVVAIETELPRGRLLLENTGSGFVFDPDGYILTNEHVVHEAQTIRVTLPDKRKFLARLVGADMRSDLAVLKIETPDLPVLPVGSADDVQVGEVVVALGNPFGTGADGEPVSTFGRVNRLHQTSADLDPENDRFYDNLIQTTALTFPGSSGGPLIDGRGRAIGINTAMGAVAGTAAQFGFAIAFDAKTRSILEQLTAGGTVYHAFLGVETDTIDAETQRQMDLKDISGARVTTVLLGSPAQLAGIRRDDVIRAINSRRIYSPQDLTGTINDFQPNQTIQIDLLRRGETQTQPLTLSVQLAQRSLEDLYGYTEEARQGSILVWGLEVKNISRWRRRILDLPPGQTGVLVYSVTAGSAADQQHLQPGDVIIGLGQYKVDNTEDFAIVAEKYRDLPRVITLGEDR
ncbi:MAG: trypsin-like peptidase domain-containing protein [Sedimentisphaerales bacterium]|nr:trypsin-like peptidase domain-containing protein [Sedimentisphaerales bacterium]